MLRVITSWFKFEKLLNIFFYPLRQSILHEVQLEGGEDEHKEVGQQHKGQRPKQKTTSFELFSEDLGRKREERLSLILQSLSDD